MKKIGILLLVIMNAVLLSGCWDRVEINDIAIVIAVGVDKMDNGDICLSLLLPVPKKLSSSGSGSSGGGGGEGNGSTLVISESGKSIMDAYRKLQGKLPREILFSHIRFIIIGEKLAQEGVAGVLDFFSRPRQSNLRAHILFTRENIDEVLGGEPGIEQSVAEMIREEGEMGIGAGIDLKDFINMLNEEGVNPWAGQLVKLPLAVETKKNEKTEASKPKKSYFSIRGAAVFDKDKLVGWINYDEVRGVLWLRDEVKRGVGAVNVDVPEEKGGGKMGMRILEAKTRLQPKINEDVLTIHVYIEATTVIYDNSSKLDLSDPKIIYDAEKMAENRIKGRTQSALDKLQKQLQSDVLGFGTAVYREYPKEWREKYKDNWHEEFPELNVEVACKVSIPRVGFVTNSLTRKEDEIIK
ncbi:MAG: germination protein Ger(X)C family [Massilibacillus sp.]|jgi:spore germination protein KC|nr:germination protein Ger(X)C family [Massilibacillus sp.]